MPTASKLRLRPPTQGRDAVGRYGCRIKIATGGERGVLHRRNRPGRIDINPRR